MISKRVQETLEEAMRKEDEVGQFYLDSLQSIRNASLASLFESLYNEQVEHKRLLELQLETLKRGDGAEAESENIASSEGIDGKKHDEIKTAKKAVKVFSDKAEELWKKSVSFEQELAIAGEIQSNLLPRTMPEIEDLEISATFIMSRKVGGDYFDFYLNNKRQLFFVIGDVMGKGIPAALLQSSLRALWRSGAYQNLSPRKIVEKINQGSVEDFRVNGSFATLFSACYIPVKSSLWFCNAGHDPPLYLQRARNESIPLTTPGVVVGIDPHCAFQQKVQKMSSGDLVLFYSDGLWEVTDPDRQGLYNREKVSKLLVEHRERPAEEILAEIMTQVKGLSGNIPQRDDITLVLMKRR